MWGKKIGFLRILMRGSNCRSEGHKVGVLEKMGEALVGRYWCYMCNQVVNPVVEAEIKCPYCDGGFVEEMNGREDLDTTDFGSDRALSLWAPILLGMVGNSSRRRRYHREEDDYEPDQDRELESILRRRRRSSAALLHLLQGLRAELALESSNSVNDRERDRDMDGDRERGRDREGLILINPFNQAIILQGSLDSNHNRNSDGPPGASLGDYFVGPGLDLLLQHLAENDPNRYGTPPAKKEAVESMPTVEVGECLSCPVCLEEFDIGSEAKEMPCKHVFHNDCILPWLEMHSSCPVCRFQMPIDESKESDPPSNMRRTDGNRHGEDVRSSESDRRFWVPVPWPFSGLFSSSDSQGNGNSASSSSSSRTSRENPHEDGE